MSRLLLLSGVFFIPFRFFNLPLQFISVATAAVFVIINPNRSSLIKPPAILLLLFLHGAAIVYYSLIDETFAANLEFIVRFFALLVFCYLTYVIGDQPAVRQKVCLVFIAACVIVVCGRLLHLEMFRLADSDIYGDRTSSYGLNPNYYAFNLGVALIFSLSFLDKRPYLVIPIMGLIAIELILTESRAVELALLISVVTYFLLRYGITGRAMFCLIILIGSLTCIAFLNEVSPYNFSTSFSPLSRWENVSLKGGWSRRELIIPAAIEMFAEKPLLGWGPVLNQVELASMIGDHESSRCVHNTLLQVLTQLGIIGGLPFLVAAFLAFKHWWNLRKTDLDLVMFVAALFIAICSLAYDVLQYDCIWIVLGLILTMKRRLASDSDPEYGYVAR